MIRAATTLAGPCTGAPRRDFRLGMRRGQPVGAHVPSWCSRHGWTLVAPDELARLASLQLVATRCLRRVQGHMSHHGAHGTEWTLVAPDELARLASLQLVATRCLPRGQVRGWKRTVKS